MESKNYTLYELEQSFKELEKKEDEANNIVMDINALKLKNKNSSPYAFVYFVNINSKENIYWKEVKKYFRSEKEEIEQSEFARDEHL